MKRQTIGLGTKTTSTGIYAVAGWGQETIGFEAISYVVDGFRLPYRIIEMNREACDLPLSEAPAVIQQYFAERSLMFTTA
jgi:hypothetical protein